MAVAKVNDEEFVKTFETHGAKKAAEILGVVARAVYNRRRRLEQALGRSINATATTTRITSAEFESRMIFEIDNGIIPIGSDGLPLFPETIQKRNTNGGNEWRLV